MSLSRLITTGCMLLSLATPAFVQVVNPEIYAGMKWRSIGPFRGGRSLACVGSPQRPKEYYFGATGGGVWKSTDGGTNWEAVSDGFLGTASVGALAIAPSNPDIVYAGTGERDIRGDISHGDGVYRTDDAGKTWRNIGLQDTQTISRIVVDPKDPNIVYVAALGHVYGKHPARGVYKTLDGGKTWAMVLSGADRVGTVDLVMDPADSNILLAANWEAWRTPYTLVSGGPGSGLFKSTDSGKTWMDLTRKPGLPKGIIGKIGVSISPVDPKRYWALVEAQDGGLFVSDDAGESWKLANDNRNWRQRAWYYTHVYSDPKNRDGVYVLNVGVGKSMDGGKTFSNLNPPHGDNHDLWIAPDDPNRFIESNDGGASVSADGGKTWSDLDFPTGQFYHVSTDNAFPYRILGAQQDNSTVRMPSRVAGPGIGSKDWTGTAGGESGFVVAKPNDPEIVYGGSYGGDLSFINYRTGESRAVDPWPDNPMGHGAIDLKHRFQWTYPIVFSPNDPNVLYTCSQYVMMSSNGGDSWQVISPDLTRNDPATLQSSGGPITKDNTSVEYYGTVFAFAESPRKKGLLWAGSDDGLVHVSQNGGRDWQDVTPKDMPKWGLISSVEPSFFSPGTCYISVDNHENDDYMPYAYKTTDFGKTWTKIVSGIPQTTFMRTVREDHKQPGLLFGGTETGAIVSFNDGATWQPLQMNLPVTPVHDFAWKDDDLIAATHGRGFWVLDDLTPLQQLSKDRANVTRFFAPKDAVAVRWGGGFGGRRRGGNADASEPLGQNPMSGVILNYYLASDSEEPKFEIKDSKGVTVATVNGPKGKGFQRTSTFMQYPSFRGFPGMILWSGFSSPIAAPPGDYQVTMTAGSYSKSYKFHWQKDPRWSAGEKDLVDKFELQQKIVAKLNSVNDAVVQIRSIRAGLEKASKEAEGKNPPASLPTDIAALQTRLTEVEEALYQTKNRSGQDPLNYPIRLNDKLSGVFSVVSSSDFRPTKQSYEVFADLGGQADAQLKRLASLTTVDLKKVNDQLAALGIGIVKAGS
jgi:photosystem II stability/assembly factor-like uncharacterized protein